MPEGRRNPFLPPEVEVAPAEVVERDAVLGDDVEVKGPSSPIHAPRDAVDRPPVLQAPTQTPVGTQEIAVVGLHGGAGASTLAALLGDTATDAGSQLPAINPYVNERPRVLFVARTHAHGLEAAETATTAWSHGELASVNVIGLVLIDDGPKLASDTRQAVSRLLRKTPHGWHIPWVEAWRTTTTPTAPGVRIPRALKLIQRAADASSTPKGTAS